MPHRCGRFRGHALPRSRPVLPISPVDHAVVVRVAIPHVAVAILPAAVSIVVVVPIPPVVVASAPLPPVTTVARLVVAIVPERPPVMAVPHRDVAELRRN